MIEAGPLPPALTYLIYVSLVIVQLWQQHMVLRVATARVPTLWTAARVSVPNAHVLTPCAVGGVEHTREE